MDKQLQDILANSIHNWCRSNTELLLSLEKKNTTEKQQQLFVEMQKLGVLSTIADAKNDEAPHMLAVIVNCFAVYSASLACMVLQQNMANSLLAIADRQEADCWVALPMYDHPTEWCHFVQLVRSARRASLHGCWESVPLLPTANLLLLPVQINDSSEYGLLEIRLQANRKKTLQISDTARTLGLRACPVADIHFDNHTVPIKALTASSAIHKRLHQLWSQAELWVLAIRAGIFEASYRTAAEYTQDRWQGGKMVIEHSAIRAMLAQLQGQKLALNENWQTIAPSLLFDSLLNPGQLGIAHAAAEQLPWHTSDGIQLLGGVGYMEEYFQEQRFRDAKQCEMLLGHPQARRLANWSV